MDGFRETGKCRTFAVQWEISEQCRPSTSILHDICPRNLKILRLALRYRALSYTHCFQLTSSKQQPSFPSQIPERLVSYGTVRTEPSILSFYMKPRPSFSCSLHSYSRPQRREYVRDLIFSASIYVPRHITSLTFCSSRFDQRHHRYQPYPCPLRCRTVKNVNSPFTLIFASGHHK
jgi:hypothetical protein